MPKCIIDGKEVEFQPGENLVQAAKKVGIDIPVFCYHEGLSVVAQCRMCMVEVEKMPKVQTACSTRAAEGMVVHTQSEMATKARASVMEFLLINHPLDCPICDKAGECDLQDNSFKWGSQYMRYTEERRTYLDLDMGPVIKKNMNRCIHCTRCIRFGEEVAGIHEMVALKRGNNTEISTVDGKALETDYAGNYADICPTGSLTLKDFRFNKRVWYLKKQDTVCEGCSKGCNIELHYDGNRIYRTLPRPNSEINQHWICDEGRFNFHYVHDPKRIEEPSVGRAPESLKVSSWDEGIAGLRNHVSGKALFLLGTDLTLEEVKAVQDFTAANGKGVWELRHFGTKGVTSVKDDAPVDRILKMKSKTANLHGVESLGVQPFTSDEGYETVVVFRGGRAQLPALKARVIVGVGVFTKPEAGSFAVVLPGLTFAEKEGTIVNHQGKSQKIKKVIPGPRQAKPISEILMIWKNGISPR